MPLTSVAIFIAVTVAQEQRHVDYLACKAAWPLPRR